MKNFVITCLSLGVLFFASCCKNDDELPPYVEYESENSAPFNVKVTDRQGSLVTLSWEEYTDKEEDTILEATLVVGPNTYLLDKSGSKVLAGSKQIDVSQSQSRMATFIIKDSSGAVKVVNFDFSTSGNPPSDFTITSVTAEPNPFYLATVVWTPATDPDFVGIMEYVVELGPHKSTVGGITTTAKISTFGLKSGETHTVKVTAVDKEGLKTTKTFELLIP
ncbi:MAG: hypothetical protein C4K58_01805 [Flavobacteriaceae bacterium]|nr:MAG: hypothetical protein C4K58_01805 [Flavobacteriaceae bacterium]